MFLWLFVSLTLPCCYAKCVNVYHYFHSSKDVGWNMYICDWHRIWQASLHSLLLWCVGFVHWMLVQIYQDFVSLLNPCNLLVQFNVQAHVMCHYGCEFYKNILFSILLQNQQLWVHSMCFVWYVFFNGLILVKEHNFFFKYKNALCHINMLKKH